MEIIMWENSYGGDSAVGFVGKHRFNDYKYYVVSGEEDAYICVYKNNGVSLDVEFEQTLELGTPLLILKRICEMIEATGIY